MKKKQLLAVVMAAAMLPGMLIGCQKNPTESDSSLPNSAPEQSYTGDTTTQANPSGSTHSTTKAGTTASSALSTAGNTTTTSGNKQTNTTTKKTETQDTSYHGISGTDFKALAPKSVCNVGNISRLNKLFAKAQKKEKIVVGAIGGSITWGEDKTLEGQYIERIGQWFRDTFSCEVQVVNAGIGATNSLYGVHRAQQDLLKYKPDFVIVEYAVNDPDTNLAKNSYEMLVRNILQSESAPAVLLLETMSKGGKNVQEYHVECGKFYNLPVISYRDAVWPEMKYGRLKWEDLSPDDVHPNKTGHGILSLFVTEALQNIRSKKLNGSTAAYELPSGSYYKKKFGEEPIQFKNARIISAQDLVVKVTGDAKLGNLNGYQVWNLKKGSRVDIAVKASNIVLRYAYWNNGKMGWGNVTVDDEIKLYNGDTMLSLDGHFGAYMKNEGTFSPELLVTNLDKNKSHKVSISYLDMDGFYAQGTTGEVFSFIDLMVSD